MPKPVPDDEESMSECRKFCGPCPSFKPNQLNEFEPHALFCSRGQTEKPLSEVKSKSQRNHGQLWIIRIKRFPLGGNQQLFCKGIRSG